jgi:hypothetical protein
MIVEIHEFNQSFIQQNEDFETRTGCAYEDVSGNIVCDPRGPAGLAGCTGLWPLGFNLSDDNPLVSQCYDSHQINMDGPGVYVVGCMFPHWVQLLAYTDGSFKKIETDEDLKDVFAPIASEKMAILYATAATGFEPRYSLKKEEGLRYLAPVIEDTFVKAQGDGYLVHLYNYAYCSCNPHITEAIDLIVGHDGEITIATIERMYDDGLEVGVCVD